MIKEYDSHKKLRIKDKLSIWKFKRKINSKDKGELLEVISKVIDNISDKDLNNPFEKFSKGITDWSLEPTRGFYQGNIPYKSIKELFKSRLKRDLGL